MMSALSFLIHSRDSLVFESFPALALPSQPERACLALYAMSSPIAIRRASISSSGSASSASTSPESSVRALYVPVHKRSASSASSATPPSSSSHRRPESPVLNTTSNIHPCIYSSDFLLSLRPFADAEIKEKVLAACPEAAMNRRVRQRVAHAARTTSTTTTAMAPAPTTPATKPVMQRIIPRRTRFSGRAPERRRQALNLPHDSWRGLQHPSTPLPLISL